MDWDDLGASFSEELPDSIGNLEMEELDLSFCDFTGSIPSSLGSLTKITFLHLKFNNFEGQIPDVFGNFKKLIKLDFSFNNFHGLLPSSAFNNLLTNEEQFPRKTFQTIDLRSNSLQGPLPTPPQTIHHLFISENELTVEIPSGFCNITFPQVLNLSKNNLSGIIPKCLGNYDFVSV
ncbi:PREDICTED: probably inactive leucine-rich repeat receptor-like protein kinase At3g28040 [Theobroma cacao]|uniref:Probably inactive leucine-rich repeat receptor-like protein kinase At3g28040 n=1 Tax=Theobroma cacao TaxID=3641 RepID=A0AB32WPP8_THECC|nr:PREDICTED: probably inactive leucine-rich repeat receptor-like protein kinase At3g28040 [Theobroma cacao]